MQVNEVEFRPRKVRLHFLDSLRGAAAIMVVVFHLNEPQSLFPGPYKDFVSYGWLGVIAFFVISGFSIQSSASASTNWLDYARRRFWRIYPPYFASVIVVLSIVICRKLSSGTNDFIALPSSLAGVIATLTLTTTPVTSHPTINWVYWTLSCELAFYILIGITVFMAQLRWLVLIGVTIAAIINHQEFRLPIFFLDNWSVLASVPHWRFEGKAA